MVSDSISPPTSVAVAVVAAVDSVAIAEAVEASVEAVAVSVETAEAVEASVEAVVASVEAVEASVETAEAVEAVEASTWQLPMRTEVPLLLTRAPRPLSEYCDQALV